MKIHHCTQGTEEWKQARCGVVTASRFKDIMTGMKDVKSYQFVHGNGKLTRLQGDVLEYVQSVASCTAADVTDAFKCSISPLDTLEKRGYINSRASQEWSLSKTAEDYLNEIIGERISGNPAENVNSKILQWGTDYEPLARELYEERRNTLVEQCGFITDDTGVVGCSVDGLVGDDVGLEIKCRWTSREHIKCIRATSIAATLGDYVWQVQGGLWVTNRQYWDFVSYDPLMDDFYNAFYCIRVERDEKLITQLSHAVAKFCALVDEEERKVRECLRQPITTA